jgi:hypothetical protein
MSLWATPDVFSSEQFGELVTGALQSDQATKALGTVITGVFQLLFFPASRLAVENNITDASVRVIVGDVVRVLLRDFRIQTVLLIIIGLVVIGASRLLLKEDTQA